MSIQPKRPAIELIAIKHINKGSLKAFATVKVANKVVIHSLRIIQQKGQSAWVSMPQTEVPSSNGGKPRYFPIVEVVDEDLKKQICETVLSSWTPLIPADAVEEDVPF